MSLSYLCNPFHRSRILIGKSRQFLLKRIGLLFDGRDLRPRGRRSNGFSSVRFISSILGREQATRDNTVTVCGHFADALLEHLTRTVELRRLDLCIGLRFAHLARATLG